MRETEASLHGTIRIAWNRFHAILYQGGSHDKHPAVPILGEYSSVPLSARKVGALRFPGKNHPRLKAPVFFPKNLACGGTPLACLRIGNDKMFPH
ncbi:hypothetical protein AAH068_20245 [Bacteroides uniformis]|uniref:hypothetical protein n=1 Tax=Bacteroides uniformis TaxID=820 RepID=UPI0039B5B696